MDRYGTGEISGDELAALGINLNLAPYADVVSDLGSDGISTRVFSDDADTVGRMAISFKSGVDHGGVVTCFKHFPGANSGRDDPTAVQISLEQLRQEGNPRTFCRFIRQNWVREKRTFL